MPSPLPTTNEFRRKRPFHDLYVGEKIARADFPVIFSPLLVKPAIDLFLPGHVVVLGSQGCGKTMLLSLLSSRIQIEFAKKNIPFPVTNDYARFISAGIDLSYSGAMDFGNRPFDESDADRNKRLLPLFFGDFFNHMIIANILRNLELLSEEVDGTVAKRLSLKFNETTRKDLINAVHNIDQWSDVLTEVSDYAALKRKIQLRLNSYRAYLNFNSNILPVDLKNAPLTYTGTLIDDFTEILRQVDIIPKNINFFIRIDQFESLDDLGESGHLLQGQINAILRPRNAQVSYRIGTRRYAWKNHNHVRQSQAKLEPNRDLKLIDIDDILKKKEAGPWIFPKFAEDVVKKRLIHAGFDPVSSKENTITQIFGKSPTPSEKAVELAGKSSPERAINIDKAWPDPWKIFLQTLAKTDPLSAKLGEGWSLQNGKQGVLNQIPEPPFPWDGKGKNNWWHKERVEQALMQIAGRCGQKNIYAGDRTLIALGGSNILSFISICQQIWNNWLQGQKEDQSISEELPHIEPTHQTIGVIHAGRQFNDWISQQTGRGNDRRQLARTLGNYFNKKLYEDRAMSYPGHNGFSITDEELEREPKIAAFLSEMTDFGVLIESPHTSKMKSRKSRTKWYLAPLLCVHYNIPHVRTKEPYYASIENVKTWIAEAGLAGFTPPSEQINPLNTINQNRPIQTQEGHAQLSFTLFDDEVC